MYREKYAKKTASHLFAQGRPREEIVAMLLEEGAAPDQVEQLADKYWTTHRLLLREDARKNLKTARMMITIGGVLLGCGIFLSLLSLLYLNGSYIVYFGLLLAGAGFLIKGLQEKKAAISKESSLADQ